MNVLEEDRGEGREKWRKTKEKICGCGEDEQAARQQEIRKSREEIHMDVMRTDMRAMGVEEADAEDRRISKRMTC